MTREETVRNLLTELTDMIDNGSQRDLDRADEICTSIIKLFEQEPCEDCVSREEVIIINQKYHGYMPNEVNHKMWKEFNELSSVRPIRIHAEWVHVNEGYNDEAWVCSNCKKDSPFDYDFCPNCGADMREVEE